MRKYILPTLFGTLVVAALALAQALPDLYQSSWPYHIYSTRNGTNYLSPGTTSISSNLNGGTLHFAMPSTNYQTIAYDFFRISVATNSAGNLVTTIDSDPIWGPLTFGSTASSNQVNLVVSNLTVVAGGVASIPTGSTFSSASIATNTAPSTVITNDFVSGAFQTLRNQRAIVTVSLAGTVSSSGGLRYSNAVNGKVRTFLVGSGTTNTITVFMNPNSQFAVTNATVQADTSEINYQ